LLKGDYSQAVSIYRRSLHNVEGKKYTIQLELACENSTIDTGLKEGNRSPQYFILEQRFRGRTCYCACWGLYSSPEEARTALESVPAFFKSQRYPPIIIPLRKYR
jgi:septal ring-binding cell division protein DamX